MAGEKALTYKVGTKGDGFKPRKPDFNLKVKCKGTGVTATVGVAWMSPDECSISIQLNPGTVLSWHDNLYITLFPREEGAEQ